jgi:hypothetical protein
VTHQGNLTVLMEVSQTNPNVVLGGSGDMGFIFPTVVSEVLMPCL